MIKLENFEVVGWEHAIRGVRNPKNSWKKSDSAFSEDSGAWCRACPYDQNTCINDDYAHCINIGPNDHTLMMTLAKGGPVHAKYRRMITVYVDITAPLYWWKEFDTYKVGTVANSCSTMHKLPDKEFTLEDFSYEHLMCDEHDEIAKEYAEDLNYITHYNYKGALEHTVNALNSARDHYLLARTKPMKNESKRQELLKLYFDQMIQLLPSSYNQKRTVMLNYEVLTNIYRWRRNHKLDEWHVFCDWIESLPYSEIITGETVKEGKDDE